MITELTPQQEKDLIEFRDRWMEIGLSTEPADRPRAEKAITQLYKNAGKSEPEFVWVDSPKAIFSKVAELKGIPYSDARRLALNSSFSGQYDSYWVAFYLFWEQIGVEYAPEKSAELHLWAEISQSCGRFSTLDNLVIISERPIIQKINDRRVGHNEDGPAIAFRDGLKIWMLNGVVVDEQIVMAPETQTIEQIRKEANEEVKRIRIERYGWTKYVEKIHATQLDQARNDVDGTEERLYNTETGVVLVCACPSTAKVFALEVPPETKTCEEAQRYLSSGLNARTISSS